MLPTDRPRSRLSPYVIAPIAIAAAAAIGSLLLFSGGGDNHDSDEPMLGGPVRIDRERERVSERAAAVPIPIPAMPSAAEIAAAEAEAEAAAAKAAAEAERTLKLEEARSAGVLGQAALTQGGAFAHITGAGDISSGFSDADIQGGLIGNEAGEMSGGFGFGRSGFGPGGGGTGQGGLGTYGTLGHGSGTGQGYGSGGSRGSTTNPQVRIGQPEATGNLDKAIIRRYIKRSINRITYCYEKQLLAKPGLEGTVRATFTISPSGTVSSSTASGMNDDVATCVANVIHGIEFPKPTDGGSVSVVYPFNFRPDGG